MMIRTRIFEGSGLYYRMVIDRGEIQLHVMVHKCWSKDRRYLCYRMQLYNGHSISDIILRNYTTKSMIHYKLPCWHYVLLFFPYEFTFSARRLASPYKPDITSLPLLKSITALPASNLSYFFLNNLHMTIILLAK